MPTNIQGLFNTLSKAQDQIVNAIVTLDSLSKDLKQFDGEIATALPLRLKANIEKLTAIIEGPEDSSLANLSTFIRESPVSSFLDQGVVKKGKPVISTSSYTEGDNEVSEEGIDVTPDTSNGPKSAVAAMAGSLNDSILNKYLKKGGSNLKENVLSIDIALSDENVANDYEEAYEDSNYASEYFDEDDEFVDEVSNEDEVSDDDFSDWRSTNKAFNPDEEKSLDFESIVSNKDLVNIDDEDTDLVGKLNSGDIPYDDFSELIPNSNTAPVNNDDDFVGDVFDNLDGEEASDDTSVEDDSDEEYDWRSLAKGGDIDFGTISGASATDGI